MKFYETGADLAKEMGVELSVLEQTTEEHYQAAKKTEKDPDGGSWPAYPSGKSWDEASGKTGSGKKFYHNVIPGAAGVLRRDHHAGYPLLHGRPRDRRKLAVPRRHR